MSQELRDQIAIAALQGIVTRGDYSHINDAARLSYQIADAMLTERNRVQGEQEGRTVKPLATMQNNTPGSMKKLQREEIEYLLTKPVFSDEEKGKVRKEMDSYTSEKADKVIKFLTKTFDERMVEGYGKEEETGELATVPQTELLWKLVQSSVVTLVEKNIVQVNLKTLTKKRAGELIDYWTSEIKLRKSKKEATV